LSSIRDLTLKVAARKFPEADGEYLVIKEPNGSIGAPLLMEALPESRMILLVRDPRDAVASALDARRKDGWLRKRGGEERGNPSDRQSESFVRDRATVYLQNLSNSKAAFDAHQGRKAMVRYEELRADTLNTMRRLYSDLGLEVDEAELSRVVEKHSWENIPEDKKGEGKFYRKAKPGGWREDLTPEQVEIVEKVTAPVIEEFYAKR
jgi:hypothetical protein